MVPQTQDRADETVVFPTNEEGSVCTVSMVHGRYQVERQLGAGGMALVYQVVDLETGEHLALKVPRSSSRRHAARLTMEAEAMRACAHPHVPTVHAAGEDGGVSWLVLEWATGGSTADVLAASGPLPLPVVASWAVQVACALSTVHDRGMVHRDVKPANLLLAADGRVLLSDFGVALVPGVALDSPSARIGSPAYMAPEQVAGGRQGPQADLFALGATLFTLSIGHSAEVTGTEADPRWLAVPEPLRDVIRRATRPDPQDRPNDTRAMVAPLFRYVPDEIWGRLPHLGRWAA